MRISAFSYFVLTLFVFVASFVSSRQVSADELDSKKRLSELATWLPKAVGQKVMLDLRFYCPNRAAESSNSAPSKFQSKPQKACRTPLLNLTPELKLALKKHHIGGVILFAENMSNLQQIKSLTDELHNINPELPMFIGIDQENGRVARLPRDSVTSFPGNMPLGAIYSGDKRLGLELAQQSYAQTGKTLASLGFNVNFAPNVDVNNNPDNPVINIRSFGDKPKLVANLGARAVQGLQQSVSAAIKHFPGHGDTNVDSHTGLPLVSKSKAEVMATELMPFKQIIKEEQPDFVMSAHIQFPKLDDTQIQTRNGDNILVPATFSRVILTEMLRNEFGFDGLIVTDALDMAAISRFFEPEQAIRNAFKAGADIALMPLVIDSPGALAQLDKTLRAIEFMVLSNDIDRNEVYDSYMRIVALKQKQKQKQNLSRPSLAKIEKQSRILSQRIAEQSVFFSEVSEEKSTRWFSNAFLQSEERLFAVMPDRGKCDALINGLKKQLSIHHLCWDTQQLDKALESSQSRRDLVDLLTKYDSVLVSTLSPKQSSYEMVGIDTSSKRELRALSTRAVKANNLVLIQIAKQKKMKTAVVSLRAPYDLKHYQGQTDWHFATFSYNVIKGKKLANTSASALLYSPVFDALSKALLGKIKNSAKLPVDIDSV